MDASTKTYRITVTKPLAATAAEVFQAFTDATTWREVHECHAAEVDLRVGGRIVVQFFEDRPGGETFVIRKLDPPRRMVFHWEGHETQEVTLEIEDMGRGVVVHITQACGTDPGWIVNNLDGWAWILDSLEHHRETGKGLTHAEWSERYATHRLVGRDATPPTAEPGA